MDPKFLEKLPRKKKKSWKNFLAKKKKSWKNLLLYVCTAGERRVQATAATWQSTAAGYCTVKHSILRTAARLKCPCRGLNRPGRGFVRRSVDSNVSFFVVGLCVQHWLSATACLLSPENKGVTPAAN
jgi:hypothetical protein